MDAIKIQIEVGLKETTLETIARILGGATLVRSCTSQTAEKNNVVKNPEVAAKTVAPTTVSTDGQAVPDNVVLGEAVRSALKERGVAKESIFTLFEEFGIKSSRECPDDRRVELLSRLNSLTA